MEVKSKFRDMIKYRAGALCLVGILTATFMHSTTFMSQFFYNSIILGAIAAFAVDAGVVAMSIFKDELLKNGELAWMVRVVTSLVLFASGIANMSEGFKSAYGVALTFDTMMSMDWLTLTQWLAGTIIFPVLAYVMCDTIGTRNLIELRKAQIAAAPQPVGASRAISAPRRKGNIRAAQAQASRNKQQRLKRLEEYLESNPQATLSEMADAVGVSSRETVRKYLDEMGQTSKNGYKFSDN
jgi:hypothetical protein